MRSLKRMAALVMIVAICVSCAACKKGSDEAKEKYGSTTLKVFIPGEYNSDNFFTDFEKEFGVTVIPEYFDSNEMMYTKFSARKSSFRRSTNH